MNDIKFLFPESPQELVYEFNRRMKSDEYPEKMVIWNWYESEANILMRKGYMEFNFLYPNSMLQLDELYKVLFGKDPSEHVKSNAELRGEIIYKSIKENRCLTEEECNQLEKLY